MQKEEQEEIREEETIKEKELRKANISLILDSYNDIFSDFDPRSFSERALSDDFLLECNRAARDKNEKTIELNLLMPKNKRSFNDESKIKKRLKDHFKKHYLEKEKEMKRIKRGGAIMIASGMLMMLISYFLYSESIIVNEIIKNILLVITEPAGWFLFWIGGERLVYRASEKRPEYIFYKKMANCHINFASY